MFLSLVVVFCVVDGIVFVSEWSLERGISMLSQHLASHQSSKVFSMSVKDAISLDEAYDPRTAGEDLPPTVMGLAMDTSGVDQVQELQYYKRWGYEPSDEPDPSPCEVKVGDSVTCAVKRFSWVARVTTTSLHEERSVKLHRVDGVFPLSTVVSDEENATTTFFIQRSHGTDGQYRNMVRAM